MLREWFGAKFLAGLPGLPKGRRNILICADRESWLSRPRSGRGGGREYHISSLPPETQLYLREQYGRTEIGNPASATVSAGDELFGFDAVDRLPRARAGSEVSVGIDGSGRDFLQPDRAVHRQENQKSQQLGFSRLDAKLEVLGLLSGFCSQQGLNICKCRHRFADAYNGGGIDVPASLRSRIPTVSDSTLARWQRELTEGSRADGYGNRRGDTLIDRDPDILQVCKAFIDKRPVRIEQELRERFSDRKLPSYRTIARWQERWIAENPAAYAKLTDEYAFNSKFRSAAGSYSEAVTHALQRIEIDATKGDIFLQAPGGKFERYSILFVVDVFSRRAKGFVAKYSNAEIASQGCLRWILQHWGKCEEMMFVTDRGKEFLSRHFLGCLEALGIAHKACTGRSGWEKPFVERLFGTNTRDLLANLPGFCGHDVSERQKIRSRVDSNDVEAFLTPEQLQSALDQWTADYENRKHGGEGLNGVKTPLERWAESPVAIDTSYRHDPRPLDILLSKVGTRVVQKKGIKIEDAWYINADGLHVRYIGQRLLVRRDPYEVATIHCFSGDGREYLFSAEDFAAKGWNRAVAAKNAHQEQRESLAEVREVKAARNAMEPLPTKVISFNAFRTKKLRTATERTAAEVVEESHAPAPSPQPLSPEGRAIQARLMEEQERLSQQHQPQESLGQRFYRLYVAKLCGEAVTEDEEAFIGRYLELHISDTLAEIARVDAQQRMGQLGGFEE